MSTPAVDPSNVKYYQAFSGMNMGGRCPLGEVVMPMIKPGRNVARQNVDYVTLK